jgi:hypothetical protein
MWEPYFKATLKRVTGAAGKIAHGRFHIMKHTLRMRPSRD